MKVVVEIPFAGRTNQPAPKKDLDTYMEEAEEELGMVGDDARGERGRRRRRRRREGLTGWVSSQAGASYALPKVF